MKLWPIKLQSQEETVLPVRFPKWFRIAAPIAFVVIAVVVPLFAPPFTNYTLSMIMIYALAGMGLNLLTGYTGQISIGHNFFIALGAYTTAALSDAGFDPLIGFPVAAILCFVVGFVIGLPALRMGALEFALVTLTLALIIPAIVNRLSFLTGGHNGLTISFTSPEWTGLALDQYAYYWCLALAVVGFIVFIRFASGRIGRSLIAVRDFEGVARSVGVRASILKTEVFAVSAVYAGMAGVLYALVVRYVAPDSFGINMSIGLITVIVVGGLSMPFGAIVGAIFVVMVPQLASGTSSAGAIYGVTLILVVFFLSTGIVGAARRTVHWVRARREESKAR